jgi:hypothetical protein
MEKQFVNGEISFHPDVFHYTILCSMWAISGQKIASARVVEILARMLDRASKFWCDIMNIGQVIGNPLMIIFFVLRIRN